MYIMFAPSCVALFAMLTIELVNLYKRGTNA
jgi:hypothetical protein